MNNTIFERSLVTINSYSQIDLFGLGFAIGLLVLAFLTIFYNSAKISKEINKNVLYALIVAIVAYFMPFPSIKFIIITALLILMIKINIERLNKIGSSFGIKPLAAIDPQNLVRIATIAIAITSLLLIVSSSIINIKLVYYFYKQLILLLFGFWVAITIILRWFKN